MFLPGSFCVAVVTMLPNVLIGTELYPCANVRHDKPRSEKAAPR